MHECSRCCGCMEKVTSDIHHVAHTYERLTPCYAKLIGATVFLHLNHVNCCIAE